MHPYSMVSDFLESKINTYAFLIKNGKSVLCTSINDKKIFHLALLSMSVMPSCVFLLLVLGGCWTSAGGSSSDET